MFTEILVAVLALAVFGYWKFRQRTQMWQKQGVKVPDGLTFPIGNTPFLHKDLILRRANVNDVIKRQYDEFENEAYFGTYGPLGAPICIIRDLDLIKNIMVKDFASFTDRNAVLAFTSSNKTDAYWENQLFFLRGKEWKDARSLFTPIFTSGKMKLMVQLIEAVTMKLDDAISSASDSNEPVDMRHLLGKFSMDTIASCAFGVDAQSFTNKESKFVRYAKEVFRRDAIDILLFTMYNIPGLKQMVDMINLPIFKPKETQYFASILKETLHQRQHNEGRRNDLVDLMIDALEKSTDSKGEDELKLISTAILILVAGYDTTALTMSYCLYQLALKPDIQERLRNEIDEACQEAEGKLPNYSTIQNLEYLDMVLHETLRYYSPAGITTRCVANAYRIPGTTVTLPAQSEIHIPIHGIHRDPKYYETPDEFNPEHFTKSAREERHPFAFLAFGQGPRNCIGMRFALLEAKMAMVAILSRYSIKKCPETPETTRYDPQANLGNSIDPLLVKIVRRDNPSMNAR